ncbi:MAG: ROK family protein [Candidatus Latescibacteria bacterium]|nr:ROK family protein [Candidatus Latescibacterota bacterium]
MKRLYVGVDLGGTNVRSGLVDEDGTVLSRDTRKTLARESAEAPVKQIVDSITESVRAGGSSFSEIRGIGIGSPGPLDARKGKILRAGNLPHWINFPLTDIIKERVDVDTYLQNDANMFAFGEWWMGAGRGIDDFFVLTLGTGIGGGAVCGGKLLTGFNDNACEFGHTSIDYNGAQCWCGQKGCIELYSSATGIVRITLEELANEHIETSLSEYRTNPEGFNSHVLFKAAEAGDTFALSMFDKAGYLLGLALLNAHNLLNFKRVAIGGGLARSGELIFEPARRAFRDRGFQSFIHEVEIVPAEKPDDAAMLGAVRLVMEKEAGS